MEHPIKMDDLGVPLFLETPILIYLRCVKSVERYTNKNTIKFDQVDRIESTSKPWKKRIFRIGNKQVKKNNKLKTSHTR